MSLEEAEIVVAAEGEIRRAVSEGMSQLQYQNGPGQRPVGSCLDAVVKRLGWATLRPVAPRGDLVPVFWSWLMRIEASGKGDRGMSRRRLRLWKISR
jgi:hypothetical protein